MTDSFFSEALEGLMLVPLRPHRPHVNESLPPPSFRRAIIKACFKPAAIALAAAGSLAAAQVDSLNPIESRAIDLGAVAGNAYYTVEPDGLHVVATFAQREDGAAPIRFQATLAPGQAVTFSSPCGLGQPAAEVSLTRHDDVVTVARTGL